MRPNAGARQKHKGVKARRLQRDRRTSHHAAHRMTEQGSSIYPKRSQEREDKGAPALPARGPVPWQRACRRTLEDPPAAPEQKATGAARAIDNRGRSPVIHEQVPRQAPRLHPCTQPLRRVAAQTVAPGPRAVQVSPIERGCCPAIRQSGTCSRQVNKLDEQCCERMASPLWERLPRLPPRLLRRSHMSSDLVPHICEFVTACGA